MRLDRRRWFKDSAAQLKLNKIAEFRKSNLKGYFRDEQMQARERLLLAKRAGG